ncbi:hypothetical protein M408DRAFT_330202 [Serendipita vermifera MAFF 305830]|uniref:F-box domain-containing protein n=1 Tax=Serendipita vermifera MAFF 305830 TaxID=933852 RepID=A0A0C3B4C7_SERVB|nr:hypothetical protein M408DRAFT_330202 [Serendipita vermifera MAFF 305830]
MLAGDPTIKSHVPLLSMTQVCRHWRKVAIALPMLWTSLYPTMSVRDVARSLRRSNGLPLDFTISGIQGTAGHWEHFHEHIGRCKRIAIKDIPPEWIADLQPWLDNPAPLLEELVLSAVPSQHPISSDLDLTFFDQTTPLLYKVRLDTIILPRSSFHLLLNITHLEFSFGHGPKIGCQIPSHRYILDLLSCAPLLQDALIERYGTEHLPYFRTYPPDYTPTRVKLDHLRKMCVQGMAPIELGWMEYIDIPLNCCLKIGIDLAHHQNLAPLLALLDNPSNGLRPLLRVQETMFTGSTSPGNPNARANDRDKLGIHLWDPNSQLAVGIVFRSPQSREQTELIMWMMSMTLFRRYTPRCLAWSTLNSRFVMGPGIYIRVLMNHTTISDLAFDDCHFVTDALKLLVASERSASNYTGPGTAVVCPNLAYLALSRCRSLPGTVLVDLARARDVRGKTLRKLRIKECDSVHRRSVADFRWLVEEVEWDGETEWDGFSTMADMDPDDARDLLVDMDKVDEDGDWETVDHGDEYDLQESNGSDEEETRDRKKQFGSLANQSVETFTERGRRHGVARSLVSDSGE